MPEAQVLDRTLRGLHTAPNLNQVPEGAAVWCRNIAIRRPGVASKMRGFRRYGSALTGAPSSLLEFEKKLVTLDGSSLKYDSDNAGAWTAWSGSFSPAAAGDTFRSVVDRRTLFLATSLGVYSTDGIATAPSLAGVHPALHPSLSGIETVGSTWLAVNYFVRYRYVVAVKDAHGRLLLSAPSSPLLVRNTEASEAKVRIYTWFPQAPAGLQVWLYRTPSASTAAVGSYYYLVRKSRTIFETTQLLFDDEVPDDLLGEELYTNPSRHGPSQENSRPPWARDVVEHRGRAIFANVRRPHQLRLRLLDASALSDGDTVTIERGAESVVLTARSSGGLASGEFLISGDATASVAIRETMEEFCRALTWLYKDGNSSFYAHYTSADDEPPGYVTIYAGDFSTTQFDVIGSGASIGGAFDPAIRNSAAETEAESEQEVKQNAFSYSRYEQPEAVPVGNVQPVGPDAVEILRVMKLRFGVLFFTEQGIYRLTGDTPSDYDVHEFDSTVVLEAPNTAVILGNSVYALTNQGVVRVDEVSGAAIISIQVKDILDRVRSYPNYKTLSHAVAYESENEYWLFLPESASATEATRALVYNYVTREWYDRGKRASAGHVLSRTGKLYLAHAADPYVLEERKDLSASDFVEETISANVTGASGLTATVTWTYTGATPEFGWLVESGGSRALVTDVDALGGNSYLLTLSADLGLVAPTTVSLSPGVDSELVPAPESVHNPSSEKQFYFVQVDLESNTVWLLELDFASNFLGNWRRFVPSGAIQIITPGWGSGGWESPAWGSDEPPAAPIGCPVPLPYQRGEKLSAKIRHRTAREDFHLLTLSYTHRVTGTATVREPD